MLGGWQISGATFMRSGTPLWVVRGGRHCRHRRWVRQSWSTGGEPEGANEEFSAGEPDQNFWFDPPRSRKAAAGTFGNGPRNNIYNPGEYQWDIAIFKNFNLGGTKRAQFRAEIFNFLNHANWGSVQTGTLNGDILIADPSQANFGRVTSKTGQRDVQLSIRVLF